MKLYKCNFANSCDLTCEHKGEHSWQCQKGFHPCQRFVSGMVKCEHVRTISPKINSEDRIKMLRSCGNRCFYCGREISSRYKFRLTKRNNSEGRTLSNLHPSCPSCSSMRIRFTSDDAMRKGIAAILARQIGESAVMGFSYKGQYIGKDDAMNFHSIFHGCGNSEGVIE